MLKSALIVCMAAVLCGCFHSPLSVKAGTMEEGIRGVVTDGAGAPVESAYAYLYRSASTRLIGPSDFMEKTDASGTFVFDVPEGTYHLVVRKRERGGEAGPLKTGDRSSVYPHNPIAVRKGAVTAVSVTLPEKTGLYARRMPVGDTPVSLSLTRPTDKVLKVLVYAGGDLKKAPAFVIEMTGATIEFGLDRGKTYVVVVREEMREKVGDGEMYAESPPFTPESLTGPIVLSPEPRR